MAQTLRDFIAQREAEIRDQVRALKDELRELQAAKAAIDEAAAAGREEARPPRMGQRDMIKAVLDDHPQGGDAVRIINLVAQRFGTEIAKGSISTQLSRLKAEGGAVFDPATRIWRSTLHAGDAQVPPSENEPASDGSEAEAEGVVPPSAANPFN